MTMENYEGEGDTLRMGIELAVPVCRNRNEHGSMLTGSLLCSVWFFFSYMLIGNEAACKREVVRFEEWMVRLLGGSDKDKQSV